MNSSIFSLQSPNSESRYGLDPELLPSAVSSFILSLHIFSDFCSSSSDSERLFPAQLLSGFYPKGRHTSKASRSLASIDLRRTPPMCVTLYITCLRKLAKWLKVKGPVLVLVNSNSVSWLLFLTRSTTNLQIIIQVFLWQRDELHMFIRRL